MGRNYIYISENKENFMRNNDEKTQRKKKTKKQN